MIELLVTIGMIGIIAGVIAASVSVIFRTEQPVSTMIGESHDVQQAVNYFHLDVESGPRLAANWDMAPSAGTGCSPAGTENVMSFEVADELGVPARRVGYRLSAPGGGRLDRYDCSWNVGTASWDTDDTLNIADRLDTSGGPAVSVSLLTEAAEPSKVDRVTMEFAQSITDKDFSATPRTESGLVDGPVAGDCVADPLDAAMGFGVFIEGATHIKRGPVRGSLATGGLLSWEDNLSVATVDSNNIGGFTTVAAYAAAGFNWPFSTAITPPAKMTTLLGGSNLNVVLAPPPPPPPALPAPGDGTAYNAVTTSGVLRVYETATTGPFFETRGSLYNTSAYPIEFDVQFDELRACADLLGLMPYSADAEFVVPTTSGTDVTIDFVGSNARVLNIHESQLPGITSVTKGSGTPLATNKPLVVNISEDPLDADDKVVWNFTAASWSSVGDAKFVLINFPNTIDEVTVEQDVYGTIFAPYAHVITKGSIQGNVIAKSWTHQGNAIASTVSNEGSKMFAGTITWL